MEIITTLAKRKKLCSADAVITVILRETRRARTVMMRSSDRTESASSARPRRKPEG